MQFDVVQYRLYALFILIASAKIREREGSIQLLWVTAGLLVKRFIVLSTQWMKEMRCEFSPLPGVSARIWNLED